MGRNRFCYHPVNGHVRNDLNPDVDYHYTEREVKKKETIEVYSLGTTALYCFVFSQMTLFWLYA